jgi:hypothetical protein
MGEWGAWAEGLTRMGGRIDARGRDVEEEIYRRGTEGTEVRGVKGGHWVGDCTRGYN